MNYLTGLISFFWFIRTIKAVLFWVYLWQLKEYHIGRFVDHFRTTKGRELFFNKLFFAKLVILLLFWLNAYIAFFALLLVYAAECLLSLTKKPKLPVFTIKATLLSLGCLLAIVLLGSYAQTLPALSFALFLLICDIATPLIVTAIVLACQPLFVFLRYRTIAKATHKMSQCKHVSVVAITGSYGKTSTKEFLTTILSSKFKVLATKEHRNSEMGIAKTILQELDVSHQIFVVEMGAYKKGGIELLCNMVQPHIGIVTGVNEQHLATFGSMENILSAEGGQELAASLPPDGILIVNGDNKYCVDLYKNFSGNKKIYSQDNSRLDADVFSKEATIHFDYLDFLAMTKAHQTAPVRAHLLGQHNIENLLGAITVALELGMSLEEVSLAVKNIKPSQGGMELRQGLNGITIIDSSYSSNPNGVMADVNYLNVFSGKKIVVMPCLIELGKQSSNVHFMIGKKIAEVCDFAIITTKDRLHDIKRGAMHAGFSPERIIFSENLSEIVHMITTSCTQGDAVLLEGRVPKQLLGLLMQNKS